jgi:hypothetical protein
MEKAPVLYNALDLFSTSPLAFTINSPSGIDPRSPLPRVRTLTAPAPWASLA